MKKIIFVALVAAAALVLLPLTGMAGMTAIPDSAMESVTGQLEIGIDATELDIGIELPINAGSTLLGGFLTVDGFIAANIGGTLSANISLLNAGGALAAGLNLSGLVIGVPTLGLNVDILSAIDLSDPSTPLAMNYIGLASLNLDNTKLSVNALALDLTVAPTIILP